MHCAVQRCSLAIRGRQVEVLPAVRGDFYAAVTQRLDAQDSELLNLELEMEAAAVAAQAAAAAKQQQQQQPITAPRSAAPRSPAVSPVAPRAALHYEQPQQQQQQPPLARQSSPQRQPQAAPTAASVVIAGLAAAAPSPPPQVPAQTHASVVRRSPARTAAAVVAGNGRHKGSLPLVSPPKTLADSSSATTAAAAAAAAATAAAGDDHSPTAAGKADSKSSSSSTVIRMRGLPYRASKAEVAAFFEGCALADDGVILVTKSDGKATGEAYVHFASRDDMRTALRKDREMLGNRYIELFASSAEEMQRYCRAAAR
jgi:RNA recognition motif. (a.k.a. RRM, RBD, or RNP domain)